MQEVKRNRQMKSGAGGDAGGERERGKHRAAYR